MIGIQEMASITQKDEYKELGKSIMEMLDRNYFDYDERNIWGTGIKQKEEKAPVMGKDDQAKIFESLKNIPLREFLAKSGTTGIAGAAYLIPAKIYQILQDNATLPDIVSDISSAVLGPDQIGGTTVKVDIPMGGTYAPKEFSSGGIMPTETISTTQATLDFTDVFGINFRITNDLIEDAQWDLIELHLREAGKEMGEYASNLAVTILITAPDGDGTLNASAADSGETKFGGSAGKDIVGAMRGNLDDGWVSNTLCTSHHSAIHSILATCGLTSNESTVWNEFTHSGWPGSVAGMNIVYNDTAYMNNTAAARYFVITFDKAHALLSGRKRWLRIEKYSEPIRDLVGATVTARQDSITMHKDAIYVLTEA